MSRPLVIGIGNAMRGDDGAGLLAARRLVARKPSTYDVREADGEAATLLELWRDRPRVLVIDALDGALPPGTIVRHDAGKHPLPCATFSCSSHALGLAEAVELARSLGRLPEEIVVFGIQAEHFEHGAPPSESVRATLSTLCDRIENEIAGHGDECDNSSDRLDPAAADSYPS